jgi:hypothetical protein
METIEEKSNKLRGKIKFYEEETRELMDIPTTKTEVKENIMLAVRHLEDARMRLGKVIQYSGDGISKYDKG